MICHDRLIWVLVTGFLTMVLTGCGGGHVAQSGFLGDYTEMVPSEKDDRILIYKSPTLALRDYKRFIVEPVVVYFHPDAKGGGVDPAKLKEIADGFHDEIVAALGDRYPVVEDAGAGVIRLKAAITDVEPSKPILNLHWSTSLPKLGLGGASAEVDFVDSVTGERVAAVMAHAQGKSYKKIKGLTKYGHAQDVLKGWAKQIRDRLDEINAE